MRYLSIILTAILFLFVATGCMPNNDLTKQTLEKAGYSNVEILGLDMWGCSDDDFYQTRFRADNPVGDSVEGTVCCGMFLKKCTIRF